MKIKGFGVSMRLCSEESKKYPEMKSSERAYLYMLKDFVNFVKKSGFEIIELTSTSVFPADLLLPISDKIKKEISSFKRVTYHLPIGEINISAFHQGIRREAIKETKKHIDLAQKIGIDRVVMHPGCFLAMPKIYSLMEKQIREIAKRSIFEIFDYCKTKNIQLSVENLPRNEPLFQRPEEFEVFVEEGVGVCLDTVHAFESDVDPLDFIRKFRKKIKEIHLTDGVYSDPIVHYPLGLGEVDLVSILDELEKINYQGPVILEVNSKIDLKKSKKYLKSIGYL